MMLYMSVFDNEKYRQMELVPGEYVPDLGLDYPTDDPLFRMRPITPVRSYKNDSSYPFLNDSLAFKLKRNFVYFLVDVPLRLVLRLKHGVRIEGKDILKKHRKLLSKGIITVSNHIFPLDALCIRMATGRRMWIPMLPDLFESKDWWLLTHLGGIPLADGSLSATKKFNAAFDELNRRGQAVHIFPEARSWLYYKPLRPFMKGAFTMSYKWACPIIPICLAYRPRTGIYKLFGKPEIPLITVRIGEPIIPDTSVPRKIEVDRLCEEAHKTICRLGGILKNPWPSVLNEN